MYIQLLCSPTLPPELAAAHESLERQKLKKRQQNKQQQGDEESDPPAEQTRPQQQQQPKRQRLLQTPRLQLQQSQQQLPQRDDRAREGRAEWRPRRQSRSNMQQQQQQHAGQASAAAAADAGQSEEEDGMSDGGSSELVDEDTETDSDFTPGDEEAEDGGETEGDGSAFEQLTASTAGGSESESFEDSQYFSQNESDEQEAWEDKAPVQEEAEEWTEDDIPLSILLARMHRQAAAAAHKPEAGTAASAAVQGQGLRTKPRSNMAVRATDAKSSAGAMGAVGRSDSGGVASHVPVAPLVSRAVKSDYQQLFCVCGLPAAEQQPRLYQTTLLFRRAMASQQLQTSPHHVIAGCTVIVLCHRGCCQPAAGLPPFAMLAGQSTSISTRLSFVGMVVLYLAGQSLH